MEFINRKVLISAACLGIALSCCVSASATETGADAASAMPLESVFSRALRFQGDVVATTSAGKEIRQTAFLRGKRFEYVGEAGERRAAAEKQNAWSQFGCLQVAA